MFQKKNLSIYPLVKKIRTFLSSYTIFQFDVVFLAITFSEAVKRWASFLLLILSQDLHLLLI